MVESRREQNRMGEGAGGTRLVEARFCIVEQSGGAGHEGRAEGRAGFTGVGPTGVGADDVLTGRSDPNIGRTVIGKGRSRIPVRRRSDANNVPVHRRRVNTGAGVFVSGCGHEDDARFVRVSHCTGQRGRRRGQIEAHVYHVGFVLHGVV